MNKPLVAFQAFCRRAFSFLVLEHHFRECEPNPSSPNPFVLQFTNGAIGLRISGEGWGTIAVVEYLSTERLPVPTVFLEPGWAPGSLRKKARKAKTQSQTQEQQVEAAAARIRERDRDILSGEYARLDDIAAQWRQARLTLQDGV